MLKLLLLINNILCNTMPEFKIYKSFRSVMMTMWTMMALRLILRWKVGCRCPFGWQQSSSPNCSRPPSRTSTPSTRIRRCSLEWNLLLFRWTSGGPDYSEHDNHFNRKIICSFQEWKLLCEIHTTLFEEVLSSWYINLIIQSFFHIKLKNKVS